MSNFERIWEDVKKELSGCQAILKLCEDLVKLVLAEADEGWEWR
jgi:hypothetical protein